MKRFALPILAAAALVFGAPFIGQIRAALQAAFPRQYIRIVASVIAVCVGLAVAAALVRIKQYRGFRYGCIVVSLALGIGYATLSRTGDPTIDVVERFHFVEYGIVTLLFYHAWRPIDDASVLVLPVLAGLLVATCEEWLQWFVPARVGEVRDVFLNLWAIICGLLFSVAFDPPEALEISLSRASWIRVRRFAAVTLLVFALFFHSVHLGYAIEERDFGVFRSTYTREKLRAIAVDRTERWRIDPPLTWSRLSREDQYFSEGIVHVRARNRCWSENDFQCAWRENVILERFFAPVIDTPSYVSATGHRWPAEQRADAERRAATAKTSAGVLREETLIVAWPKPMFWAAVAIIIGMLLFV